MNLYVLVEGKKCERKVYAQWIPELVPKLSRVEDYRSAGHNNFFLISAEGYPSILDVHIPNALRDIESAARYDAFMIVLDSDDEEPEARKGKIAEAINRSNISIRGLTIIPIVQNCCIETWFLGNRRVFTRHPLDESLRSYINHYYVSMDDPERMPKFRGFSTKSQFHCDYLKRMLAEKEIRYSKRNPGPVSDPAYLKQLLQRVNEEPGHLKSFQVLARECESLMRMR